MRTVRCDCCRTGTQASGLEVLVAAGWTLVEDAPGEELVVLCPLCTWQRGRAAEAVKIAVESAQAASPAPDSGTTRHGKGRGWWFWT